MSGANPSSGTYCLANLDKPPVPLGLEGDHVPPRASGMPPQALGAAGCSPESHGPTLTSLRYVGEAAFAASFPDPLCSNTHLLQVTSLSFLWGVLDTRHHLVAYLTDSPCLSSAVPIGLAAPRQCVPLFLFRSFSQHLGRSPAQSKF